jgi:hypothetical protein
MTNPTLQQRLRLKGLPTFTRATMHDTNGTSLRGTIECSYWDLVSILGPPDVQDGWKSKVSWDLRFGCGTVARIYDWKEFGTPTGEIREWNIGGHNQRAVYLISKVLKADLTTSKYR